MGYWAKIARRTTERTNHTLLLESTERIVIAGILAILTIAVLLFLGRGEEAQGELILRGIGVALVLCLWPIVWVFNYFREQPKIYNENVQRIHELESAHQPCIDIGWRFKSPYAELILTNKSTESINGIEVMLRNFRKADGSCVEDIMQSLSSVDGKQAPVKLNPQAPTYFRFIKLMQHKDKYIMAIKWEDRLEKWLRDEAQVKLSVSGDNIPYQPINLKLSILSDNNTIAIEQL